MSQVMAIVNATPDSFYDGNPQNTAAGIFARAEQFIREGADLLDIGGESTRPESAPVSEATERARVIPLIKLLHQQWPEVILSLDTTKLAIAEEGLTNGVQIVNDVSGQPSPELFALVKKFNAKLVLMHTRGTPQTMQTQTDYNNVVSEVKDFLSEKISQALTAGLVKEQLIIDPGFGFAKTRAQNYELLKNLHKFKTLGVPLLVALSRKSFLSAPGDTPQDRLPQTLGANLLALQQGADILRVHDVKSTRRLLQFYQETEMQNA